jgi:glycerol-3-phosphate O-acyltransferase 3/4
MQWQAFAAVGQKHVGFVGFMQQTVLKSLGCLWFERNEQRERSLVAKR